MEDPFPRKALLGFVVRIIPGDCVCRTRFTWSRFTNLATLHTMMRAAKGFTFGQDCAIPFTKVSQTVRAAIWHQVTSNNCGLVRFLTLHVARGGIGFILVQQFQRHAMIDAIQGVSTKYTQNRIIIHLTLLAFAPTLSYSVRFAFLHLGQSDWAFFALGFNLANSAPLYTGKKVANHSPWTPWGKQTSSKISIWSGGFPFLSNTFTHLHRGHFRYDYTWRFGLLPDRVLK
jgi:hypothetical protein